jgi:DNA-directed RNA polymerase subunit RPC12/RpoP
MIKNVRFTEETKTENEQIVRKTKVTCDSCGYRLFMKHTHISSVPGVKLNQKRTMYNCEYPGCIRVLCEGCLSDQNVFCSLHEKISE